MTMNDIQRAHLALFAAREAGQRGSAEQMKAIAMCIRNRVRQGWHDADWMQVIENAEDTRANEPGPRVILDANNRSFQRLIMDIDEIYFARRDWQKEPSRDPMPSMDEAIGNAVYWAFLDRPFTGWFIKLLEDSKNHPLKASMGTMMFYE